MTETDSCIRTSYGLPRLKFITVSKNHYVYFFIRKERNGSTTLEVTFINCDYQLLWLKIVVNGEIKSNHPDMLQSGTLVVAEKKYNILDSKYKQLTGL